MKTWFLFLLLLPVSLTAAQTQVAVIANKSVPADAIDTRRLLTIYSLEETKWEDGSRIALFDLKGNSDLKQTFYTFLGRRPEDMKRTWLRIILSGEGRSPTVLQSTEEVLEKVAEIPGAIGYIPLDRVTDSVQVLATIQTL